MLSLLRLYLFGNHWSGRWVVSGMLFMSGLAVVYAAVFTQPQAAVTEYHVDRTAKNLVKFISDAPFDDFEGVTEKIDGYVALEVDSLAVDATYTGSKFYFEVPLATLDTGIGLRNEDMREDFLETDQYPYATYEGTIVGVERAPDTGFVVTAEGNLTIHGVTRPVTTKSTVTSSGRSYHVRTAFDVKLQDHDIEVPQLLFLRVNEVIAVQLDFWVKKAEQQAR